jgi:hypothetical protein
MNVLNKGIYIQSASDINKLYEMQILVKAKMDKNIKTEEA